MNYKYNQKPNTTFTANAQNIIEQIKQSEYSVLVGRNNCGKSFLLKYMRQQLFLEASYIGPMRYNNFDLLGFYTPDQNKKSNDWDMHNKWFSSNQNIDNSPLNLQQTIANLTDVQREIFKEIIKIILDVDLDIEQTIPENSMSQKYVSCNGQNLSFTSSGFRLIATLITCLLSEDYGILFIDEPELGISPEAQGTLADFLFNREQRIKYFPHIKTLVFASHSTIFLDRLSISNNYIVEKQDDVIEINQVTTQAEFNKIHFFLLGNRFETLYLPTVIILVEGISDQKYITKVLEIEFPGSQFSVINATNDSRMKETLNLAKGIFSDMQKSPYRDRIMPILDNVHGKDIIPNLEAMGVRRENIIVWDKNGIEYYYPSAIIDIIYGGVEELLIDNDNVRRNDISYKKAELSEKVILQMKEGIDYPEEFQIKFLNRIEFITGLFSKTTLRLKALS